MKWLMSIVGILLVLLGILWILQGINVVRVGFMAGHLQYAAIGLVAAIAGLGLLLLANRRSPNAPVSGTRN